MALEHCLGPVCFFHLDPAAPKIFGFAELLAGLALIVVAWTIADFRFKFRIATAPIPVVRISSIIVMSVSVLALLTDLWRAEAWLVPGGGPLTSASWQFLLAAAFLGAFLLWVWYAIVSPPAFGKLNANRFTLRLYQVIYHGSEHEVAVAADELMRSIPKIIRHSTNLENPFDIRRFAERGTIKIPEVESCANDILSLIAYPRVCRIILAQSPGTIVNLFVEIARSKRFHVSAGTFGRNILREGLAQKDSPFYQESDEYEVGLIGHIKPMTTAMFGSYDVVLGQSHMFEQQWEDRVDWTHVELRGYCNVVLLTLEDFLRREEVEQSTVIAAAVSYIEESLKDEFASHNIVSIHESSAANNLRAVLNFCQKSVRLMNGSAALSKLPFYTKHRGQHYQFVLFDYWVELIYQAIIRTNSLKSGTWDSRNLQLLIWDQIFTNAAFRSRPGRSILKRLRRKMYQSVKDLQRLPLYPGARVISFCLIVMDGSDGQGNYGREGKALYRVVKGWMRRHYARLHESNAIIAAECLPAPYAYDPESFTIHSGHADKNSPLHGEFMKVAPAGGINKDLITNLKI